MILLSLIIESIKNMENSPEIKEFISQNSNLFWYIPEDKKTEISHVFLMETILNYGDMDSIFQLN